MDIHHYLDVNKDNGRKYRYYKSLGYSEKAACVLATLTVAAQKPNFTINGISVPKHTKNGTIIRLRRS